MLARGLCRLAADVPKTSTHDLPRLSTSLRSSLLSRNGLSAPAACAFLRVYKVGLSRNRRSYATTTRATTPTAKVKRDVKKAAAAKKPTKKVASKKTKKKTVAKKKAVAKPKRVKKQPTPEQKEKLAIKELKEQALKTPPSGNSLSAWNIYLTESATPGTKMAEHLAEISAKFKALSPAEREHYNHLANEGQAKRRAEFDAWISNYTPEQIRLANNARAALKRKAAAGTKISVTSRNLRRIQDNRQLKKPLTGYVRFFKDRRLSGDFKNIGSIDACKLIGEEWKALSASEKKKYEDEYAEDRAAYVDEYRKTYGRSPS